MNVTPLESPLAASPLANGAMALDNALSLGLAPPPAIGADSIAAPTGFGATAPQLASTAAEMYNPMSSMMAQLMQMMQMLMSALGLGSQYGGYGGSGYGGYGGYGCPGGYGGYGPCGNEQYYANATGASQGDPHLSFNGNTWDSMVSQPNLLQSNSFPGGYQISTQVTPPTGRGVTYNQSATVSLGGATVSLNNAGQASIQEYGQNVPIAPGQTVQLGNGESVTCNQNGSLSILAQNGQGGQISTTLTATGPGVNVNVSAQNVDLGGALANGGQVIPQQPVPTPVFPTPPPFPVRQPGPYQPD